VISIELRRVRPVSVSVLARQAFCMSGASVLFAACSGSPPIGAPDAVPQSRAIVTHAARSGSWMLPEAKSDDLVYASSGTTAKVVVYDYRSRQKVGVLSGFEDPTGICSNAAGDVFVTDRSKSQIIEYPHGGSDPISTLDDAYYAPVDCAVDPLTGDLAVANITKPGSSSYPTGSIAVYAKSRGKPKFYNVSPNLSFAACTYDDMGNLFADGFGYSSGVNLQMVELNKKHKILDEVALNPSLPPFDGTGGLQWDGRYVDLGTASNIVYRYSVRNGMAYQQGSGIDFSGQGIGFGLFWIGRAPEHRAHLQPLRLLGLAPGLSISGHPYDEVYYYTFPAGGSPRHILRVTGPFGVTVSFAKN
jgi:hypothetical protein